MPSLAMWKSPSSVPESAPPEWLVAKMPPGYRNRYEEMQRVSNVIKGMDKVGQLLWECGAPLEEAAQEAFLALKTGVEWLDGHAALVVGLEGGRRLLVHIAQEEGPLAKKSGALTAAFRVLQDLAGPNDRTVLLATSDRTVAPEERGETVTAEGVDLLKRMGVTVLPAAELFTLWTTSLTDLKDARAGLDQLHAQDGGTFTVKTR